MFVSTRRSTLNKKQPGYSNAGIFVPASGVLAAIAGNTLSSNPVSGVSTGTLISLQLSTPVGAKPVAAAPFSVYTLENTYASHPLSRNSGTLVPNNPQPTLAYGQLVTNPPAGLGTVAGAYQYFPNGYSSLANAPFASGFGGTNTTGNWYQCLKKYETAYCENNKRMRLWGTQSGGGASDLWGDVVWNEVTHQDDGQGGYNWTGGNITPAGTTCQITNTYFNPGLNVWSTYELEFVSGTLGNFDGRFNTWINGYSPLHGSTPTNGAAWNHVYNGLNLSGNQNTPYYNCVSVGEITDNGPHTATAWSPGITVTSSQYYSQGTSPVNGRPYIFQVLTGGTCGTTGPIGCGGNPHYEVGLGSNSYSEPGSTGPVKWYWICDDTYNPSGLSGAQWFYGMIYLDDSICRIFNSTESSYSLTGQVYNQRELQIPTAWDSTGNNITYSVRQGAHPTAGPLTYQYVIDASGTAHSVGTMQW